MPTGYTASVGDGKITEFRDFAMQCARAFGALVEMRDEPNDAAIPDEIKPSPWYAEATERERVKLAKLEAMTAEEAERAAVAAFDASVEYAKNRRDERNATRQRYEAMLSQVNAWQPPTPEHEEMKRFMREQLTRSIEFDCSEFTSDRPDAPMAGAEWLRTQIEEARKSVAYYEKNYREEVQRAADRNRWVKQLRDSLSAVTA